MFLRRVGSLVLAASLLGGCGANVGSSAKFDSNGVGHWSVSVRFDGEIARVIEGSSSLESQLVALISSRVHTPVQLSRQRGSLVWSSAEVRESTVTQNSDVTGVASVSSSFGSNGYNVRVGLVRPDALVAAIEQGAQGRSDQESLVATMENFTRVSLSLSFDATPAIVVGGGVGGSISSNTATFSSSLAKWRAGTVVVSAAKATTTTSGWWFLGAVVALGLVGVVLMLPKRRV